eukprot:CAMPEP_0172500636 /NCGR_PEP_ID=MMETSP1066-20121228/141165_1 /TAXON_ID=671091 /ORGANISM="Coscinodiscus wailesii, Strain CCMP2513" /LENGTH=106 /DNA_ID=CAMNT_0013274971 /DNA_START=121 /DNA_END=441 /DNA_ORIENTATION=+
MTPTLLPARNADATLRRDRYRDLRQIGRYCFEFGKGGLDGRRGIVGVSPSFHESFELGEEGVGVGEEGEGVGYTGGNVVIVVVVVVIVVRRGVEVEGGRGELEVRG